MGITLQKQPCIGASKIVICLLFPEKPNPMNDKLWTLWRNQKDAIRADGFSIGKDETTGNWIIKHFTDATPDNKMLVATADGRQATRYMVEFGKKCEKWEAILKLIEVSPKKNFSSYNKTMPYQAYTERASKAPNNFPRLEVATSTNYLQNINWGAPADKKNIEYIEDEDF